MAARFGLVGPIEPSGVLPEDHGLLVGREPGEGFTDHRQRFVVAVLLRDVRKIAAPQEPRWSETIVHRAGYVEAIAVRIICLAEVITPAQLDVHLRKVGEAQQWLQLRR